MLSQRLKIARNNAGFTQDDIAGYLRVIRQTYSAYETGRSKPDSDTLKMLAKLYNVSADYLLGNTNNPTPYDQAPQKPTIEETILNNDELSEESRKDLLKQVQMFKMLDELKKRNEEEAEELKPKLT